MKKTQGEGEVMLMMKIRLKGGWKYLFEGEGGGFKRQGSRLIGG